MHKTTLIPINRIYQETVKEVSVKTKKLQTPQDGVDVVKELISNTGSAHYVVMSLNESYEVTSKEIVHLGALNDNLIHPRDMFKNALLSNAVAIVIAHNHPSHILKPSEEEIATTKQFIEAGQLIGIRVIDHIIVNDRDQYYSMKMLEDI